MTDGELEEAMATAAGSTEGLVKLREIEQRARETEAGLKVRFAELAVEEERIHADDRGSARQLAIATGIWPQVILSTLYTIGYFWVLWLYLTGRVADLMPEQQAMTTTLVGALTAVQVQILNFWFGSSSGSKDKTAAMARNGH